jgi:hypothetical protein
MEELDLGGDLTYSERPIKILDTVERVTRSKVINVKYSGVTTPRMEPRGNVRRSSEQITPSYFLVLPESQG